MSKQFNQNLKGKLYTPSLVESQNMIKPSLFNFKYSFKNNLKSLSQKLYKELKAEKDRKKRSREFMDSIIKGLLAKNLYPMTYWV